MVEHMLAAKARPHLDVSLAARSLADWRVCVAPMMDWTD